MSRSSLPDQTNNIQSLNRKPSKTKFIILIFSNQTQNIPFWLFAPDVTNGKKKIQQKMKQQELSRVESVKQPLLCYLSCAIATCPCQVSYIATCQCHIICPYLVDRHIIAMSSSTSACLITIDCHVSFDYHVSPNLNPSQFNSDQFILS